MIIETYFVLKGLVVQHKHKENLKNVEIGDPIMYCI